MGARARGLALIGVCHRQVMFAFARGAAMASRHCRHLITGTRTAAPQSRGVFRANTLAQPSLNAVKPNAAAGRNSVPTLPGSCTPAQAPNTARRSLPRPACAPGCGRCRARPDGAHRPAYQPHGPPPDMVLPGAARPARALFQRCLGAEQSLQRRACLRAPGRTRPRPEISPHCAGTPRWKQGGRHVDLCAFFPAGDAVRSSEDILIYRNAAYFTTRGRLRNLYQAFLRSRPGSSKL